MNKIIISSIISIAAINASAQNVYEAGNVLQSDLNGTARYVGMGGALNALGADLSVMGSNPAGIGLYRRSDVNFTFGGQITGNSGMDGASKGRMSVDQGGAVFTFPVDDSGHGLQFINFGINYKKNRNFFSNSNLDVQNLDNTFSQTFQIADLVYYSSVSFGASPEDRNDYWKVLPFLASDAPYAYNSNYNSNVSYDYVYNNPYKIVYDGLSDAEKEKFAKLTPNEQKEMLNNYSGILRLETSRFGEKESNPDNLPYKYDFTGIAAKRACYQHTTTGGNHQVDLNVSSNISDRFYLGLSLGIYDLDYTRNSYYYENGTDGISYDLTNWYRSKGSGFDVKLGFICRPIEESPFRLGVSVQTPTWYNITEANGATICSYYGDTPSAGGQNIIFSDSDDSGDYDYHFHSPWKFNFSFGHTVGNYLALGAEYEISDYGSARYSSANGSDYDYFDGINQTIKDILKLQHTLKLGAEIKPAEHFSLRLGYNFVSSMYDKNGCKDLIPSDATTETDYTNWGAINRLTFGLGWNWNGGYFDLAYQCQLQKGDFYAFSDSFTDIDASGNEVLYTLKPTTVYNNRHQIMATLGFRF